MARQPLPVTLPESAPALHRCPDSDRTNTGSDMKAATTTKQDLRHQAETCRRLAEREPDPKIAEKLKQLAEEFESKAERGW
jgi:hypothetical protein